MKLTCCKYSNYYLISYRFMGGFIQDNYFWGEEAAWGDLIFLGGTKNPLRHHGEGT